MAACGRSEYSGDQRFPISGQVSYDGEPVDFGSISFIPVDGDKQRVSGGYISAGKYEVPEAQGPNAGKYKIEIRWQKRTGKKFKQAQTGEMEDERKEGLPTKFHKDSQLTVDVSGDKASYDFELKSTD
jgi:hypothetical protein